MNKNKKKNINKLRQTLFTKFNEMNPELYESKSKSDEQPKETKKENDISAIICAAWECIIQ